MKRVVYHPITKILALILFFTFAFSTVYNIAYCVWLDGVDLFDEEPEFHYIQGSTYDEELYWPYAVYEYRAMRDEQDNYYWYSPSDPLVDTIINGLRALSVSDGKLTYPAYETLGTLKYPEETGQALRAYLTELYGNNTNFAFRVEHEGEVLMSNMEDIPGKITLLAEHTSLITVEYVTERDTRHTVTFSFIYGLRPGLPVNDAYKAYYTAWEADVGRAYTVLSNAIVSGCVTLLFLVLLLCITGKRYEGDGVSLCWLDRLPLEIPTAVAVLACIGGICLLGEMTYWPDFIRLLGGWFGYRTMTDANRLQLSLLLCVGFAMVAVILVWLCSLVRRMRAGGWWKNTLVWRVLSFVLRLLRFLGNGVLSVFSHLPLLYKWLIGCPVFGIWTLVALLGRSAPLAALWFLTVLLVLAYGCVWLIRLDKVRSGAEKVAEGNLDYRIDKGTFRINGVAGSIADSLNHIGDALGVAVDQRMRSERFRTELITNVSHDLKTPLTSIVSYADLLSKESLDGSAAEYVEVICRQSERLKKLTEDLLEASKASTGTLSVVLAPTDVAELLSQAAGEYAERFQKASLTPCLQLPDGERLCVMADGRRMWRVFDNLLSNICKYSMEGTRVYLTAEREGDTVRLIFRNISAQPIGGSVEELTERFVRGDASRHTEGSGLGLAIAQSLVELQGGTLTLSADGDLFKAVLTLKAV